MVIDFVLPPDGLTPAGAGVRLTSTPEAARVLVWGQLDEEVLEQLNETLSLLPRDPGLPVLVRIRSTGLDFGVAARLRQILSTHRLRDARRLAVWADEPLVRHGIPVALLHPNPPLSGCSWAEAVPAEEASRADPPPEA